MTQTTETDQTETATRHVVIDMKGPGRADVVLDGEHIEEHVVAFHLTARGRELPQLIMELAPRTVIDSRFEGMAHVMIGDDPEPLDPGPAAAEFLAAIDAGELEKAALNREDLPDGTLTEAMLRQLIEWALGKS